jgi:hypothetical protein
MVVVSLPLDFATYSVERLEMLLDFVCSTNLPMFCQQIFCGNQIYSDFSQPSDILKNLEKSCSG